MRWSIDIGAERAGLKGRVWALFLFRHCAILSLPKLVWRERRRAEGGRLRLGALCRGRARLSAMQLSLGSYCQNHRTVNCDPCTHSSINKGRYNCQNKRGRLSAGRQSKLKIQDLLIYFMRANHRKGQHLYCACQCHSYKPELLHKSLHDILKTL